MAARSRACSSVALASRDSAAAMASRRAFRRAKRARAFGSVIESSRSMAKLYRVERGLPEKEWVVPRNARTSVVGRGQIAKWPNGEMAKEIHSYLAPPCWEQGSGFAADWTGGVASLHPPLQTCRPSVCSELSEVHNGRGERHDSRGSSWAWKGGAMTRIAGVDASGRKGKATRRRGVAPRGKGKGKVKGSRHGVPGYPRPDTRQFSAGRDRPRPRRSCPCGPFRPRRRACS